MNGRSPDIDPDDIGHNPSENPEFSEILEARLSRRGVLKGGLYLSAAAFFGTGLIACSSSDDDDDNEDDPLQLTFAAVAKSLADALIVPTGYTASVMYATGDPINFQTSAYANNGTDNDFEFRSGDHHDGMYYFGINAAGTAWDPNVSSKGLLCMNHEVCEDLGFVHPNGPTDYGSGNTNARPTLEIDKEVAAHGVSVIEVNQGTGTYGVNKGSMFNRRINGASLMDLSGPAAGSALMQTAFSPVGTQTRGTVNNCANGYTPWGTYLTCEENWAGYFNRREDNANRTAKEVTAFSRYGIGNATSGRYNWSRSGAGDTTDLYRRWDAGATGASATDDFRNVANTFGWIVEIDAFSNTSVPRKRTALGRFGHEGCWPAAAVEGQPLVFYMGDDSRNEYIYKYVSDSPWSAADVNGGLAAGDKYLNSGKMYVARFNADGSGEWVLLSLSNPTVAGFTGYAFADEADVVVNIRLAADAVGATKMDRPEWGAVNPVTGETYMTLTNSVSSSSGRGSATPLDAANPRYYADAKGSSTNRGNVNGHIIRWRENGDDPAATTFTWDVYLFGAQSDADANVNISGLSADNDFSSPDGCWFSHATKGLLWIQTDDGAYTDVSNCMMLAALPGSVGDGSSVSVVNSAVPTNGNADQTVTTYKGAAASTDNLRRFLVGPTACEITGIAETPDGKAIFVNIQHPGESSPGVTDPNQYTSHWPDGGTARPRSATVVITRDDGGKIGV
ncbi:MAG: PhoX family phosphatase [Chromatiales bacterium]|nr:PhoX family phosphatase [Chromatiales bacterium]